MTAPVQRIKDDFGNPLFNIPTDAQKTFEPMVEAVMVKIQVDLVEVGKKWRRSFRLNLPVQRSAQETNCYVDHQIAEFPREEPSSFQYLRDQR